MNDSVTTSRATKAQGETSGETRNRPGSDGGSGVPRGDSFPRE